MITLIKQKPVHELLGVPWQLSPAFESLPQALAINIRDDGRNGAHRLFRTSYVLSARFRETNKAGIRAMRDAAWRSETVAELSSFQWGSKHLEPTLVNRGTGDSGQLRDWMLRRQTNVALHPIFCKLPRFHQSILTLKHFTQAIDLQIKLSQSPQI